MSPPGFLVDDMNFRLCGLGALVFLCACFPDVNGIMARARAATQSQVNGAFHANGAVFPLRRCASGAQSGFNGVDVLGSDASRNRLVSEVDGTGTVIYFPPGGATSTTMKGCAQLALQRTGAAINGVAVIAGTVQLNCRGSGVQVDGAGSFQCGL